MFRLRLAFLLALAVSIVGTAPVGAFTPTLQTAAIDGGRIATSVNGVAETGAWRLALDMPGGAERLVLVVRRNDMRGEGFVAVQRLKSGRWATMERFGLDGDTHLVRTVCAPAIHACLLAGTVQPPQPSAQRLTAGFRVRGHGHWTLTGSVRQSREAFVLESWLDAPHEDLRF